MPPVSFDPTVYLVPVVLFIAVGLLFAFIRFRSASATMGQRNDLLNMGYTPLKEGKEGKARVAHYVRRHNGHEIHFISSSEVQPGKVIVDVTWVCSLAGDVPFGLQIIEAGLADKSLVGRVSDAFDRRRYNWEALFSEKVKTGDSRLDSRFVMLSDQPERALPALTTPSLTTSLLELKHVDLKMSPGEIRFQDPFYQNLWGLSGQKLVAKHQQIADILTHFAGVTAPKQAVQS